MAIGADCVAVIAGKTIPCTDPDESEFILTNCVDAIIRQSVRGIYLLEICHGL